MTQRVPREEALQLAEAEGATVVLLQIRRLSQEPEWCIASIEVLSHDVETGGGVMDFVCWEDRMTRQGADQRAEEVAKEHDAVVIGVSEVGAAEQKD